MRQKLEDRNSVIGNMLVHSKVAAEDVKNQDEQLSIAIRLMLVAGKSLSVASKQLQEANWLLAEKGGHVHLKNLQKMLRIRQQYMMAQVSGLYPVMVLAGTTTEKNCGSSFNWSKSGNSASSNALGSESMTISGLQLTTIPLKRLNFFSDKKEVQRSATALGYVANAVSLIASYLNVPLRYSLRLGGSRSYIIDYASSAEHILSDSESNSIFSTTSKLAEFSLFLEGQDTTRATYAIFLLNKDIEQLLNYIGAKSLGPRHVLANLKELFRTIQSSEYIDT